ncbi:hypothetical protein OC845_001937 [Tilletia horrida]|nr:hypothetical protein OC845_001937 [Tilletia horrida]
MTPDGGLISLDITAFEPEDESSTNPTLIVTHGLTGGSSESYVRSVLNPLCAPKNQGGKGYRAVVVNSRGCAHTPVTSPQLYSAAKTADVRCALLWATKVFPNSPLIGIGFSLGANFIAKTTAEDGDDTPLVSVIPIGAPWDLLRGSEALEGDGPGGNMLSSVYSKSMAGNLRTVYASHAATLALHTPIKPHLAALFRTSKSTEEYLQYCEHHQDGGESGWPIPAATPEATHPVAPSTLRHVDDTMTRITGGHSSPYGDFPHRSAKAYYLHGGAGGARNHLSNLRVPMLAINADDDPIVPLVVLSGVFEALGPEAIATYNKYAAKFRSPQHVAHAVRKAKGLESDNSSESLGEKQDRFKRQTTIEESSVKNRPNGNLVLALTRGGGHLGWWESVKQPGPRSTRWLHNPVGEWVDMITARVERARDLQKIEDRDLKGATLGEEEQRERDWAFRSSTRSLWNRDQGAEETRIRDFMVEIELVDQTLMPVYSVDQGDFLPHQSVKPESQDPNGEKSQAPASPLRSKVPFLLTHVLEAAPLVHPRNATIGWNANQQQRSVFSGPWTTGRVIKATMYQDSKRPEVGFAELPSDCQVAGVGTTFDGGLDVPGQSAEETAWIKHNSSRKGIKGRFKLNSRPGVVRGL